MHSRNPRHLQRTCNTSLKQHLRPQPQTSRHHCQASLPSSPRNQPTTPRLSHLGRHHQSSAQSLAAQQSRTMSTASQQPFLIRFFDPSTASSDPRNRSLATILSWPDSTLESSHNYIQILFPLPEESMFSFAPIVKSETRAAFLARPELRANLRRALARMLKFYGLQFSSVSSDDNDNGNDYSSNASGNTQETVVRGPNFASASRNWVTKFNHNHLRMTRILRSLRVLGLSSEAAALHHFLSTDEKVLRSVSPRSQMYWRRATERELHLPPDEEDEDAEGIVWLREE